MISFLSVFPPYRGGISKFSHHLYEALKPYQKTEAFNFHVLYPKIFFPGVSQITSFNDPVYAKPVLHSYNPFNWKRAANEVLKSRPQVLVYSHWHPFFAPSINSVIKAVKRRRPSLDVVGIIHNVAPHERFPFHNRITRSLFRNTDISVVLSAQTDAEYQMLMSGREPIRLFHPVYDQAHPAVSKEDLRRKYGFEADEKIVLFYGLIRQYKGLDVMIDALNLIDLGKTKIRPLIAGEFYMDPGPFLDKIKTSHLPHYEVINRYVSDEETAEILSISDLMVLPYRSASQSGVLMNAVNFHLPVVVSDLPGLTEHVKEGVTGYIFEPENPIDLARCIRLYFSETDQNHMRERVKDMKIEMSWERFAERIMEEIG